MTAHEIFETAYVHAAFQMTPLGLFACNEELESDFHRAQCIQEIWREMEYSDQKEIAELGRLEHFIGTVPTGFSLSSACVDSLGNYIPEGWGNV